MTKKRVLVNNQKLLTEQGLSIIQSSNDTGNGMWKSDFWSNQNK